MKIIGFLGTLSGKLAGIVASRNKGGAYLREFVVPVNPQSERQSLVRERISNLAKDWSGVLTDAARGTFEVLAAAFPQTDRQGSSHQLSGIAMYQKVNLTRLNVGDAVLTTAPANLDVNSSADVTLAAMGSGAVTVDITCVPELDPNERLYVEGAVNVSPGVANVSNRLRFFEATAQGAAGPHTINIPARFGSLVAGTKAHFKVKRYNADNGATSPGIVISGEVV